MTCLLCRKQLGDTVVFLQMAPDFPGAANETFHAICIEKEGGPLLIGARELWSRLGHANTWDEMIAEQGGVDGLRRS